MDDEQTKKAPIPTEKEAWIAKAAQRYIDRAALDIHVAFEAAESLYDCEDMREMSPEDAADEDMSYWTDDGDLA